jgi:hypothetical protein
MSSLQKINLLLVITSSTILSTLSILITIINININTNLKTTSITPHHLQEALLWWQLQATLNKVIE